jgi:hypothetical protein
VPQSTTASKSPKLLFRPSSLFSPCPQVSLKHIWGPALESARHSLLFSAWIFFPRPLPRHENEGEHTLERTAWEMIQKCNCSFIVMSPPLSETPSQPLRRTARDPRRHPFCPPGVNDRKPETGRKFIVSSAVRPAQQDPLARPRAVPIGVNVNVQYQ